MIVGLGIANIVLIVSSTAVIGTATTTTTATTTSTTTTTTVTILSPLSLPTAGPGEAPGAPDCLGGFQGWVPQLLKRNS